VVPAYNAGATLSETLDSIAGQEFRDWECVVVDDGSTDETAAIAERYCGTDARFRLIRQENRGTAGAYSAGIEASSADLLVICAADDLLLPAHLSVMDAFIRLNPEYDIYSSNGEYLFHESGSRRVVYSGAEWQCERSLSFDDVIAECFFSVGVVFRRRVLEMTGGHRLGVYVDDYDLWLRAMARGARHLYTPDVLSVHRVSTFQQTANYARVLESNIEVYENLLADTATPPTCRSAIERAIVRNRSALVFELQAVHLRSNVERVVGARHVESTMRTIHRVSWIVRPLRGVIARLRSR
jgi:glycosyltransferase involved in cell wall biosynthesis